MIKSGKKSNCQNYRPISISSVLSKVFEQVVFERLYIFKQVNNLFYCRQFGFKSKFSTLQAQAEITELIRNNTHLDVLCMLLDLRKAFDTKKHEILIIKLELWCERLQTTAFLLDLIVVTNLFESFRETCLQLYLHHLHHPVIMKMRARHT